MNNNIEQLIEQLIDQRINESIAKTRFSLEFAENNYIDCKISTYEYNKFFKSQIKLFDFYASELCRHIYRKQIINNLKIIKLN